MFSHPRLTYVSLFIDGDVLHLIRIEILVQIWVAACLICVMKENYSFLVVSDRGITIVLSWADFKLRIEIFPGKTFIASIDEAVCHIIGGIRVSKAMIFDLIWIISSVTT